MKKIPQLLRSLPPFTKGAFATLFFILIFSPLVLANSLGCPDYNKDKENILTAVSVFNAVSISDKTIYELAPDKEISKHNFMTQYWSYLNQDKDKAKDLNSFFSCIYQSKNMITQEIPKEIHQCQFSFNYNPKIKEYQAINDVSQAKFSCGD